MGNLDALRDWGHAKDYVRMQWLMLQQNEPKDFVIATGAQYSVRTFIQWSANLLGIELAFVGKGVDEVSFVTAIYGHDAPGVRVGDVVVRVNPRYFRPAEVETRLGDPSNAKNKLGWMPEITAKEMCREMTLADLEEAKRVKLLRDHGHDISIATEG